MTITEIFSINNIKHLRINFSLLLLPVFLFAVSQTTTKQPIQTILLFIILHLLIYPASHAWNTYYDNDNGSIGGMEVQVPKHNSLLHLANILDSLALVLCCFINSSVFILVLLYIIASRLYSYKPIRIKKYAIASFLLVIVFQGAVVYWITILTRFNSIQIFSTQHFIASIICSLMIGSSYPISQIYQHTQDANDDVQTISMLLGIKGTMLFSLLFQILLICLLSYYCISTQQLILLFAFIICMLPSSLVFFIWHNKIKNNLAEANFKNAMQYLKLASISSNILFIIYCLLSI